MQQVYHYVGSLGLMRSDEELPVRCHIQGSLDVIEWARQTNQRLDGKSPATATFIVDLDEQLWIADRHSEHVHCARGLSVLSAGEMTFTRDGDRIEVVTVTNQSTGYCPQPDSWPIVAGALQRAGIDPPPTFTTEFIFRRCESCRSINLVKEGWFECSVCDSPLPKEWNLG